MKLKKIKDLRRLAFCEHCSFFIWRTNPKQNAFEVRSNKIFLEVKKPKRSVIVELRGYSIEQNYCTGLYLA